MSIEALFFVNWIFWAALSAGTLLLVGITEWLGGTTRGYRLFMAWLLVAFAAVLLLSELALPAGVEASATSELRRPLTLLFVAGTVVYLVASLARWPRSGIAIGSGLIGLAALVTLAAAGISPRGRTPSRSPVICLRWLPAICRCTPTASRPAAGATWI